MASRGTGLMIPFAFVILFVVLGVIFLPVIFGSMEPEIDLTNNTTHAVYNTTTPIIMSMGTIWWLVGILAGLFMVVSVLIWRGR